MLKVEEKKWDEFWAYHWRVTELHKIPGIFEWDRKLVNFIEHVLDLTPGAKILDLACGGGDQAKIFAEKSYDVLGLDIVPSLVEYAQKQFEKEGLKGEFQVADMTKLNYNEEFDAVLILSGSFGFFDDDVNLDVLGRIQKALKPGGKVFIMFNSAHNPPKRSSTWSETEDGWQLIEVWFDIETCRRMSTIFIIKKDGTLLRPASEAGYHAHEAIRCYTIPEMKTLLHQSGMKYVESYSNSHLSLPPPELPCDVIRSIVVGVKE